MWKLILLLVLIVIIAMCFMLRQKGIRGGAELFTKFPKNMIKKSFHLPIDYTQFKVSPKLIYTSLAPYHFSQVQEAFKSEVKNPKNIIDVEAGIGDYTVLFAHTYPNSNIEAISRTHLLKENIKNIDFLVKWAPHGKVNVVNMNPIKYLQNMDNIDLLFINTWEHAKLNGEPISSVIKSVAPKVKTIVVKASPTIKLKFDGEIKTYNIKKEKGGIAFNLHFINTKNE